MSTTTKQKPLVPELRFSGFDGEWQNTKFRKLITSYKGGAALTPSDFVESGGSKVIPKKAIGPGGELNISLDKPTFCTTAFFNSNPNSVVNSSYLITTLRDLVPSGPSIGYVVKFIDKHEYVLAQGVYGFIMNEAVVSKDFFVQYSNTNVYRRLMIRTKVGSTQVHIRTTDYMKLVVQVPPLPEQQKIADFLGSVDAWLDNLRGQKIGLQSYKLGMMQKLFSGQVRFKDEGSKNFPDWEEKQLSDVGAIVTGTTPSTSIKKYYGGTFPWVTPTDIDESKDILTSAKLLTKDGLEKGRFIAKDSLLVTCIASIGKNAILRVDGSCNQQINAITPNLNNNVDYLYYLLAANKNELIKHAGAGAMQMLNKKDFSSIKFNLASLPEQQIIADFLTALDQTITTKADEITKVEEWKKGLMQKMFV